MDNFAVRRVNTTRAKIMDLEGTRFGGRLWAVCSARAKEQNTVKYCVLAIFASISKVYCKYRFLQKTQKHLPHLPHHRCLQLLLPQKCKKTRKFCAFDVFLPYFRGGSVCVKNGL